MCIRDCYANTPGQWGLTFDLTDTLSGSLINYSAFRGGIWLDRAVDCQMEHVILSQATVGLWVDSVGLGAEYALDIRNSVVTQAESIGLLSQGGHIQGFNNLFSNCGQACGYFALGGKIQMHLSTFVNFSSTSSGLRQFPTPLWVQYIQDNLTEIIQVCIVAIGNAVSEFRINMKGTPLNAVVCRFIPIVDIERWKLSQS